MANEMTFEELFTHLEQYVANRDYRWKLCLRVKRALSNTDCCGGIGHDQVYFEGIILLHFISTISSSCLDFYAKTLC